MKQYNQMSSKSFDKATSEWVQIRKKLYSQIKSDVIRLLGRSWKEFIPLEKNYAKELAQPWRSVSQLEVYENLALADIILMGDFHALQQSQRSHLRLLREWPSPQRLVLAVEFFQSRHQKYIDQWMKNTLSEKKFLEKIAWDHYWGFPWEHYKPLLEWARSHKVPVIGLNWGLKPSPYHSLKARENFSAICLRKAKIRYPHKKLVVIYGDLHLSDKQLPSSIRKQEGFEKSRIARVFQNSEALYFQALRKGLETKLDWIQFKNGDFCVQSVPPWVKWQSYQLFLEKTYDRQIDEWEGDIDHTDHVAKLVDFLAAEFKFKLKSSSLAVYTANDTAIYSKIRKSLNKTEWKVVQKWITQQRSFYLPELELGYLGQVTVNHTATLAGEYVHSLVSQRKKLFCSGLKDFERQIWIQAMAYLGSKVINHKRKTNSLEDLRKSLLMRETSERHRQVFLLALQQKVREIRFLSHGQLFPLRKTPKIQEFHPEAARLLGAMMGEKIYTLYQSQQWTLNFLKRILRFSVESENFVDFYYKVLKAMSLKK